MMLLAFNEAVAVLLLVFILSPAELELLDLLVALLLVLLDPVLLTDLIDPVGGSLLGESAVDLRGSRLN